MIEAIRANYQMCMACPKLSGAMCTGGRVPALAASFASSVGCPLKLFPQLVEAPPQPPPVDTAALWRALHSQRNPTPEWFAEWRSRVPSEGCSCQQTFADIVKMWPADFSSSDAFFVQGCRWHNLVNTKLGNPLMSLEAARQLYQR